MADYVSIVRELGLSNTDIRSLFEDYCQACRRCTAKVEWSCKVSAPGAQHVDRFVHVSQVEYKSVWIEAEMVLTEALLALGERREMGQPQTDLSLTLESLRHHAQQLFVGYSGPVQDQIETVKLYFSLQGEAGGLWSEAKARIGRPDLTISPPPTSGWLYVIVMPASGEPYYRIDLVYDHLDFRYPQTLAEMGTFLRDEEIDFVGAEARGIVSLRQAEREMLYSFVEHAAPDTTVMGLAARLAQELPPFSALMSELTWIGVPRAQIHDLETATMTLYTRIG